MISNTTLREAALQCLSICDATEKAAAVRAQDWNALTPGVDLALAAVHPLPGRNERPELVSPHRVPQRSLATREGRGALIHALAHIELNAVNLALDIVWRFPGLPEAFYRDWIGVAVEEARHFELLRDHLGTLGFDYGDFPAHNGLWDMAEKTRTDVLARLALVARVAEARGLDVSPGLRDKLRGGGDAAGAAILEIILADEIGHVGIGSRWFHRLCDERGLEPVAAQVELAARYEAPRRKGPFNLEARRRAGFSEAELDLLGREDQAS